MCYCIILPASARDCMLRNFLVNFGQKNWPPTIFDFWHSGAVYWKRSSRVGDQRCIATQKTSQTKDARGFSSGSPINRAAVVNYWKKICRITEHDRRSEVWQSDWLRHRSLPTPDYRHWTNSTRSLYTTQFASCAAQFRNRACAVCKFLT